MKILVTNDDGIWSEGLWAVVDAMKDAGEVFVVAPDRDRSGVGGSLTLRTPLRATEVPSQVTEGFGGIKAYAVEGTPGDSCVLALESLVGPVDLVVSGINSGSNLGEDVLISGTVGAAMQGYVRGYPSVAISVGSIKDTRYDVAAAFLRLLGVRMAEGETVPVSLINVNIPNLPADKIEDVQITRLGGRSYAESVSVREDGKYKNYTINRDRRVQRDPAEDTDIWAVQHNRISITPLYTRLTDVGNIPALETLFQGVSSHILGQPE